MSAAAAESEALAHERTDDVVRLARYASTDAHTIMELDADVDVQRWFDWPLTPAAADADAIAERLAAAHRVVDDKRRSWEIGQEFCFIIHDAANDEGLGWLSLQAEDDGRGNVSYGVLPRHRGRGIATRAVKLLDALAFSGLSLERLEIKTMATNDASRAVALRAGYRLEGVLRSYGVMQRHQPLIGQRFDWAIYGRLRSDGHEGAGPATSVRLEGE